MSWLSELFGGGGGPSPGELSWQAYYQRVAQEEADKRRREEEERVRQEERTYQEQVEQRRSEEAVANRALQQQQIEAVMKQFEPNPEELRMQELDRLQREQELQRGELRRGATAQVAGLFGPEFERGYIPETLDDPYIAQAYTAQRAKADEFLGNLLKRNVITQTGYEGGQRALEEQAPRVRTQLSDIGKTLLESERAGLRDVGGRAREAAATIDIGQAFDPSVYGTEASTRASEFGKSLSDKFASQVPGDLFDTSALPDIAGAAQFAQNLPPSDILPLATPEEEEQRKPAQRRTSTVF